MIGLPLGELRAKFSSKKEIYSFLITDCRAYLSPCSSITIYFLRDLISGKKKVI